MTITQEFPYPDLLNMLPKCRVSEFSNYYRLRPHRNIRLFIKMKHNRHGLPGIYILGGNKTIGALRRILSSYKEVHNLHAENEPFLFISENSPTFYRDKLKLVEWIKSLLNQR